LDALIYGVQGALGCAHHSLVGYRDSALYIPLMIAIDAFEFSAVDLMEYPVYRSPRDVRCWQASDFQLEDRKSPQSLNSDDDTISWLWILQRLFIILREPFGVLPVSAVQILAASRRKQVSTFRILILTLRLGTRNWFGDLKYWISIIGATF